MKRVLAIAGLLLSSVLAMPAWAGEYGGTSLGPTERLMWRFDPRPTGANRGWTGPIGYACRVETDGNDITVDRYRIYYGGGDYEYLEPLEGASRVDGVVSESTPRPESQIVARAVMTEGNFWYANNAPITPVGEECLQNGVMDAIDSFHR